MAIRKSTLFIFGILFGLNGYGQTVVPTLGGGGAIPNSTYEGFYPANSEVLSKPVQDSAQKVYRVFFTTVGRISLSGLDDFKKKAIEKLKSRRIQSPHLLKSISMEVRTELFNEGILSCPESPTTSGSQVCSYQYVVADCAGFAVNDGYELWTAGHCLSPKVSGTAWAELPASEKFVYVYDSFGNRIIGPVSASTIKFELTSRAIQPNVEKPDIDYATLIFEQPLPHWFSIGKPVSPGKVIFALGHPDETGSSTLRNSDTHYERQSGRNGQGGLLMTSFGKVLSAAEARQKFNPFDQPERSFLNHLETTAFATTADSVHGMSGGPILNESGEVVGITSSALPMFVFLNKQRVGTRSFLIGVRPPTWSQ